MEDRYKKTGNKVPIKIDELMNQVYDKLDQHDRLVAATGATPDYSPYKDPIVYTTQDGRTVQIPDEIQRQAIKDWIERPQTSSDHDQDLDLPGFSVESGQLPLAKGVERVRKRQLTDSRSGSNSLVADPDTANVCPITKELTTVVVKETNYKVVGILLLLVAAVAYYLHRTGRLKLD